MNVLVTNAVRQVVRHLCGSDDETMFKVTAGNGAEYSLSYIEDSKEPVSCHNCGESITVPRGS